MRRIVLPLVSASHVCAIAAADVIHTIATANVRVAVEVVIHVDVDIAAAPAGTPTPTATPRCTHGPTNAK